MALPYRTFYIYECDGRGRPVCLLGERSSRTSAEAVSRFLYSIRVGGNVKRYQQLKEQLVALTAMIGATDPVRPTVTVAKQPAKPAAQLDLL